jgi:hypothetical protein
MEIAQAQKIGSRITIRTFIIVVLLLEGILFFSEIRSDFANGILFFMRIHSMLYFVVLLVLLLSAWLLGRKAGKAILIKHKNYLVTGALYAAISIAFVFLCIAIYIFAIQLQLFLPTRMPLLMPIAPKFIVGPFVFIVLSIIWFLSVLQIKRRRITPNS